MKRAILFSLSLLALSVSAQNPIIQTSFTPDPAPYVHNDTVYLFTDHDEDDATYFKMKDWLLYSSVDMVNWTYRGAQMSTATFGWARQGDNAWASQAIERNGKWYWYIAAEDTTNHQHAIGVAIADSPTGPWRDAIGKPLIPGCFGYIDPTVFIDDDGQAYLFWGNNGLWYCKLNGDMTSIDGKIITVDVNPEKAFGPRVMKHDWQLGKDIMKTNYEEGPWVFKRNGLYYLVYAAGGVPEHMAYSTATSIKGPWTYRGRIQDEAQNSFTIHGGSIEFHGRNFMFYHNGTLPNGGGFHRSTCVDEFKFNDDGTIPFIPFTKEGVKTPVRNLNPYEPVQAVTMANSWGVKTDRLAGDRHYLTHIYNGSWTKLRSVDFSAAQGGSALVAEVSNIKDGGTIEFYLDNLGGEPFARVEVTPVSQLRHEVTTLKKPTGIHDVYILFRGGDDELFDFNQWQLK